MRRSSLSILIGLGVAVSACGTQNRGLESVHQPVVSRADYTFDVNGAGGLSSADQDRVRGWFESMQVGYGDRISVDMGSSWSPATRDAVADIAARYGLLLEANAPVTSGQIAPGNVRVVISRMSATVPGCPDWSRSMADDFDNHTMSNFGCAANKNLAAMVASPGDFIAGQTGSSSVDAGTISKAIKSYRSKKPTGEDGLIRESTKASQ